jgi:aminopeptidase-like protein
MYYKLLEDLSLLDRCHSGPEMTKAYELLVEYYSGSRILSYAQNRDVNFWRVPPYWTCISATLEDDNGKVIASYTKNKLSLFTYSPSVDCKISLEELQPHLFSDPDRPNSTCFYFRNQYRHWKPEWGFSIPHKIREGLSSKSSYQVKIDTDFNYKKKMIQSDYHHQGASDKIFLFVGHFDHPAQVNDGLSGCIVAYEVIKRLKGKKTRFSYRAFSSVEIVGSAHYLDDEISNSGNIREAIFLAFSGISSPIVYQQSYHKKSLLDRIVVFLMQFFQSKSENIFGHREIVGNDENIFDSVGYEISCGTIMRSPFKEYHTELDNMNITSKDRLEEVIDICLQIVEIIEENYYFSLVNAGMPCLSNPEIDLYLSPDLISGTKDNAKHDLEQFSWKGTDNEKKYLDKNACLINQLMQNILRLANGKYTLLYLAEKSKIPFGFVLMYAKLLQKKEIIVFHERER